MGRRQLRKKLQDPNIGKKQKKRIEKRLKYLGSNAGKGGKKRNRGVAGMMNRAKPVKRPGSVYRADQAAAKQKAEQQIQYQNPNYNTALGSSQVTFDENGNPTYTQSLSENQQQILDQGERLTQQGQQAAGNLMQSYQPFQSPGYGPQQYGGQGGQPIMSEQMGGMSRTDMRNQGQLQTLDMTQGGPQGRMSPPLQRQGGFQGPGSFNFTGGAEDRNRIENEVFNRLNRDTEMYRKRESDAMEQKLYNRGIRPGSDKWKEQMGDLNRRYDDIIAQNRGQAVEMGGGEMQRSYGMSLGTHQQGMSDQAQQFGQGLSTHQQGMSDMAAMQGQGTGLLMPNLPGYSGPQYNPADPSSYIYKGEEIKQGRTALDQNQQQINNENAIANKQLAMAGGGGGAPATPPFP